MTRNVEQAHIVWNKMAEAAVMVLQGKVLDDAKSQIEDSPLRGAPPQFSKIKQDSVAWACRVDGGFRCLGLQGCAFLFAG